MLTDVDLEIFPDDCEVIELNQAENFYLIQKNGSTSLRKYARSESFTIFKNHQIAELKHISIIVRDPRQRYISGLRTFAEYLVRDNDDLDFDTCLWMANRYKFLNRHYLPQFLWILNLARFMGSDCVLHIKNIEYLSTVTTKRSNIINQHKKIDIVLDQSLEYWFFLDQILIDNVNQSFTWQELVEIYQKHPCQPLNEILLRTKKILNVLP